MDKAVTLTHPDPKTKNFSQYTPAARIKGADETPVAKMDFALESIEGQRLHRLHGLCACLLLAYKCGVSHGGAREMSLAFFACLFQNKSTEFAGKQGCNRSICSLSLSALLTSSSLNEVARDVISA